MRLPITFAALGLFGLLSGSAVGQGKTKVTIGIVPSLNADLSDGQKKIVDDDFPILVRDFTGLDGTIEKETSVKELADKLMAGTTQFGVFQGIEYAEIQPQYAELQPLLLSIYRTPQVKALVVTMKDAPYKSFADLKGKEVAILKEGKEYIKRYVWKEAGGDPANFFGKIVTPPRAESALDDVRIGKVQAAIVDAGSLELYRETKPGVFAKLKTLSESAIFPPSVIAYNPKKADAAVVKQFKDGMISTNKTAKGRDVLATFKITDFEAVPPGFEQLLAAIRKEYPAN